MKELKRKLVILHTAILFLSGWGGWWLMQAVLPTYYFTGYPFIPTFFFIIGIIFISVLARANKENPRKLANLYLLLRVSKILACLLFAGIYLLAVRVQLKEFGLVYILFYLLYLGLETYYFYLTENEIKKQKMK